MEIRKVNFSISSIISYWVGVWEIDLRKSLDGKKN